MTMALPSTAASTSTDPALLTIWEAAALIASRQLSPLELVTATLRRIERFDPMLHAYVEVYEEEALSAAAAATEQVAKSGPIGPLHGIPVALKDLYDVAGRPTLAGSQVRAGHIASGDSEVTRRLRAAGAVLLGKAVTHEFAYGVISHPTRNPWDLEKIPGGSSGGSGAAVAADLCLLAMGSDTGGSIRIPAGLTGVAGLKATFGRVSKRGVAPLSWSLDHAGPLAKTVADIIPVLQCLAGYDPMDRTSIDEPVPDFSLALAGDVAGLRVGVPDSYFFDELHPEVETAVRAALEELVAAGAVLIDVHVPHVELTREVMSIAAVEAAAIHQNEVRLMPRAYGTETLALLRAGELVSGTAYLNAQRARGLVKAGFRTALTEVDLLATPTLAIPAPAYDAAIVSVAGRDISVMAALTALTSPANAAGLPALAMPCGFTSTGLPISLQLIGRPFDESTLLRTGVAYEARTPWHLRSPPLFS